MGTLVDPLKTQGSVFLANRTSFSLSFFSQILTPLKISQNEGKMFNYKAGMGRLIEMTKHNYGVWPLLGIMGYGFFVVGVGVGRRRRPAMRLQIGKKRLGNKPRASTKSFSIHRIGTVSNLKSVDHAWTTANRFSRRIARQLKSCGGSTSRKTANSGK